MKIAFIGLGTMGAPMARRLLEAGHDVTVHNRTRVREEPLAAAGASRADSPAAAAQGAEVVFTMVGDSPDVREVILGPDGVVHGLGEGAIVVDHSTIAPSVAIEVANEVRARGGWCIDAPVSGGSEGAERGTLSIMMGGDASAIERVRPLLEVLGSTLTRVGDSGSGQLAKAVNQVVIAGTYAAVAEGLTLAMASGIDVEATLTAISGGAAGSWGLVNRGPNMITGHYPLGFRTRLHYKDLGIALDAAAQHEVPLPLASWVAQQELALLRRGFGDEDVSNIARLAREAAGIDALPVAEASEED